jgi:Flp pilus assembly protein TadG
MGISSMQRQLPKRSGANTVEFALIATAFFTFVLGLTEVGRGIMITHLLTNAARVGCRTGIIENTTTAQIQTAVTNSLSTQGISGQSTSVQVNDNSADASTAQPGDEITVTVTVPASKVTWLPGGQYLKGNLSGHFTLRRE